MSLFKISDVLKGADVLEGTFNREDECIVLARRSPWCLTAILLRNEANHNNFALNICLSISRIGTHFLSLKTLPSQPNDATGGGGGGGGINDINLLWYL